MRRKVVAPQRRACLRLPATYLLIVTSIFAPRLLSAAPPAQADSIQVVPDPENAPNLLTRPLRGRGHRELWIEPIRVPSLRPGEIESGLRLLEERSGAATRILLMQGLDGTFRLQDVRRDPFRSLPGWLERTPGSAFTVDLMGAHHPTGAAVAAGVLEAVGFAPLGTRLVVVSDVATSDSSAAAIAGQLMWLERTAGPRVEPGCVETIDTPALLDSLHSSTRHMVDAQRYLRARLVDCLIGDGLRGLSNWTWLRFEQMGRTVWAAYPHNREMAFIHADGLLQHLWGSLLPGYLRFGRDFPGLRNLTQTAWDMDRPFLVRLARAQWDSIVADVQTSLSDAAIDSAVARLPPAHLRLEGDWIADRLRSRRDRLPGLADRLYRLVNEYALVELSDRSEFVEVDLLGDGELRLRVSAQPRVESPAVVFDRVFSADETKEIRLYCRGGRDLVRIGGPGSSKILLRVIGGDDADSVVDQHESNELKVAFYDPDRGTSRHSGARIEYHPVDAPKPRLWKAELGGWGTPDWGSAVRPVLDLDISGDNGLLLSGGVRYDRRAFLHDPYRSRLEGMLTYATRQNRFRTTVQHGHKDFLGPHLDSHTQLRFSGIDVLRYYGFGNESSADRDDEFYEVLSTVVGIDAQIKYTGRSGLEIGLGATYRYSDIDTTATRDELVALERPYGSGRFDYAGLIALAEWEFRDQTVRPFSKLDISVRAEFYPAILDVSEGAFGVFGGRLSSTTSLDKSERHVLHAGAKGRFGLGEVPLGREPTLGGSNDLRAYSVGRFRGRASLYGFLEHHMRAGNAYLFSFPTDLGVLAFVDVGRVYEREESSKHWHSALGGGIWMAPTIAGFPQLRDLRVQGEVAVSRENVSIYVRTGYRF